MAIYLVEHRWKSFKADFKGHKGWILKRQYTNYYDAWDFYNHLKSIADNKKVRVNKAVGGFIVYRVVKLVS